MSRPLRVLQVAYPFAPVSLDASGGAEQIVAILDDGLASRGHHSVVVACAGSRVAGTLVPGPRLPDRFDDVGCRTVRSRLESLLGHLTVEPPFDLVHLHGVDFASYLPAQGPPVLVTLHLPPSYYEAASFGVVRPNTYWVCVSSRQRSSCPESVPVLRTIPNGIRLSDYRPAPSKGGYALALGRICPEKGYHLALDAAKAAGCELLLAGPVFGYDAHERYFEDEIVVRLDARRRYLGPVGLSAKRDLLAGARCLVVPSLVPETSSLVVMEALASGTPVVSFPSGAIVDLVEAGRTGFIVSSVAEMAQALRAISAIDPNDCYQAAQRRFSADRMIEAYLDVYGAIGKGVPHAE